MTMSRDGVYLHGKDVIGQDARSRVKTALEIGKQGNAECVYIRITNLVRVLHRTNVSLILHN